MSERHIDHGGKRHVFDAEINAGTTSLRQPSIRIKKAGTATITASAAESDNFTAASATLNITVTNKLQTPTLTLTCATSQLYAGMSESTTLTYSGDGVVTYTSSNTSVATVNASGVITAVGAGTVTITASAAETSNYTAASATTTITVIAVPTGSANYVRVTGLSEIVSGEQYLIVYQNNSTATSGYALDGDFDTSAKTAVSISDYAISTAPDYAFTITKRNNGYVAQGVGSGKYLGKIILTYRISLFFGLRTSCGIKICQ